MYLPASSLASIGGVIDCSSCFSAGLGKSQTDIPMAKTNAKIAKYFMAGLKDKFTV
jgi:hypothetical protein